MHVIYNDVLNVQSAVFKLLQENRFESSAFSIFPIHTYTWVKLRVKSDVRAAFRKVLNLSLRSRQRIFVYVYMYHSTSNRPLLTLDDRCSLKIKIYCSPGLTSWWLASHRGGPFDLLPRWTAPSMLTGFWRSQSKREGKKQESTAIVRVWSVWRGAARRRGPRWLASHQLVNPAVVYTKLRGGYVTIFAGF